MCLPYTNVEKELRYAKKIVIGLYLAGIFSMHIANANEASLSEDVFWIKVLGGTIAGGGAVLNTVSDVLKYINEERARIFLNLTTVPILFRHHNGLKQAWKIIITNIDDQQIRDNELVQVEKFNEFIKNACTVQSGRGSSVSNACIIASLSSVNNAHVQVGEKKIAVPSTVAVLLELNKKQIHDSSPSARPIVLPNQTITEIAPESPYRACPALAVG